MFEGVCPAIPLLKAQFPSRPGERQAEEQAAKELPQDADRSYGAMNAGRRAWPAAGTAAEKRRESMSDMSVSSAMNSTAREYLQVAVQKKAQDAEAQAALSLLAGATAQMDTVSAAAQAPQPAAPAEGSAVDIRV